jgi:two-component system, OmpR family, response regulator MprA
VARVLVVDDQQDVRFLWRIMLTREGHEIVEAVNGTEALAAITADPPDVVLLDGHLPDMAGLDVLASTKADDRLRAIPFIVLTGDPSMEDAARARGLPVNAFLIKPVKIQDLATAVRDALR